MSVARFMHIPPPLSFLSNFIWPFLEDVRKGSCLGKQKYRKYRKDLKYLIHGEMVKMKAFSHSIKCCFREVTHGKHKYKRAPFNTMYFLSVLAVHNYSQRAIHFHTSHFVGILRMFSQNTPQNTKQSLYAFHISFEFRVLLMPQKNKPQNPLSFHANANPGTKCKKPKEECEMRKKWHEIPRYTIFVCRISWSFSCIWR